MNPLTNVRKLNKINERELLSGTAGDDRRSWHAKYRDSAWIFVGGLPYELSEGDAICIFSQYGEIVNINLIRDKKTGKFRGFGFVCYEDQRSTILAVDNFNGSKILGRTIRVDHVESYRVPKDRDDVDEETRRIWREGCAPEMVDERVKQESELREESEKKITREDEKYEKDRGKRHREEPAKKTQKEATESKKEDKMATKEDKKAKKAAKHEKDRGKRQRTK